MCSLLRKKQPRRELTDFLFGDLPIEEWPAEGGPVDDEPWSWFVKARECFAADQFQEGVETLQAITTTPGFETRQYLQAWHFLREAGVKPNDQVAKKVYAVVVEVGMQEGADTFAAYEDHAARYYNSGGESVIWEAPDDSLNEDIDDLLFAAGGLTAAIGPWEEARRPPPSDGAIRISMLTPSGIHFCEGPFDALAEEELSGPIIQVAAYVMQKLVEKTEQ